MQDVKAASACFKAGNVVQPHFSPRETEQYNYSKCSIIVRLLEFTTMVLQKCPQDLWKFMEQDIFNSSFFTLVALTVCEPSSIGFNMADLEVMSQLPEVCIPLLKALASTPYRIELECGIRRRITTQGYVFSSGCSIGFMSELFSFVCMLTVFVFLTVLRSCVMLIYMSQTPQKVMLIYIYCSQPVSSFISLGCLTQSCTVRYLLSCSV